MNDSIMFGYAFSIGVCLLIVVFVLIMTINIINMVRTGERLNDMSEFTNLKKDENGNL